MTSGSRKSGRGTNAKSLAAYLEGEITASERAGIEAELRDSADARRTLDQLQNVKNLLATPAVDLESIDLASRVRAAVRHPAGGRKAARRQRWSPLWLGGLAACVGGVLFIVARPNDDAEFRSKANATISSEGNRWAGIQVYRVSDGGAPERLSARMAPHDGLLFAYTNLGKQPFNYLMIFAVDAANQVRWFYPAYETVGTNPKSIAIERGRANVALGDLVQHDLADGALTLYALFTKEPASVLEIEAWVKEHGRPMGESPVPGGLLQRLDVQVMR
ncbi:MAG: anti-sigma factor family protein [Myxococcota bacterium]